MPDYTRREMLGLMAGAALSPAAGEPPPNILYIMADDHAAHAISAYGSNINKTPNIDRIANDGVRLTNCFCTNSICTPSRAAILTGQYSHKNGVYTLERPLDPNRNHVAKELQQRRLSDRHDRQVAPGHRSHRLRLLEYSARPGRLLRSHLHHHRRKEKVYRLLHRSDRRFQLDWLKQRDRNKPFFLMCHHKAPHRPWQPSPKYKHLFDGQTIPEPDNLFDHYEGRSRSVADDQDESRREHERNRLEARLSPAI